MQPVRIFVTQWWFVQHRNVLEANAKYFEEATSGSPFLSTSQLMGMFFY